jgi:hypothetical protein
LWNNNVSEENKIELEKISHKINKDDALKDQRKTLLENIQLRQLNDELSLSLTYEKILTMLELSK